MVQLGIVCLVVLAVYFVLEKNKERQRQIQANKTENQEGFDPHEQFNWKYEKAPLLTPMNMFIGFCGVFIIMKISQVIILSFN